MKLAAIGSNCIDFYNNVQDGTAYPGGGPVNMAVYTARQGGSAAYIGPVGNDVYGTIMRDAMAAKGVDVSHLHTLPGKTAVTQVQLVNGERVFGDYDEGVLAQYTLSAQDIDFICTHDVVVCDLWGKVEGYFEALHARGMKTAFDCATRPQDEACEVAIPHSDYVFFSSDDGDTPDLRRQMQQIAARGPKLVIAMLGEDGSMCFDGTKFYKFGIVPCEKVIDSMGAGDSYISGFLYGAVEGLPIEKCMEKGATVATETLKYFGAW
ncbi:MAG: fructoselysine 6-kinase [Oscillospiraceae bacterium]|nr:fructoselysine 6-kinase [Oscillospiraceae bacterium]